MIDFRAFQGSGLPKKKYNNKSKKAKLYVYSIMIIILNDYFLRLKVEKSAEDSKTNTLKFRDTSYIELALRFLGLLCDGQNRVIQNYFREQPDNIKTINLVSESCAFLQSFYIEVTKDNIDLITEILLTLIEMCVVSC